MAPIGWLGRLTDGLGLLQGVCHRDLKLENTLLDGRPAPRLKICDFGYSKVTSVLAAQCGLQHMFIHISCRL